MKSLPSHTTFSNNHTTSSTNLTNSNLSNVTLVVKNVMVMMQITVKCEERILDIVGSMSALTNGMLSMETNPETLSPSFLTFLPTGKNSLLSILESRVADVKVQLGISKAHGASDEGGLDLHQLFVEIKDDDK